MSSPVDIIARLRRELAAARPALGPRFDTLCHQLDELEIELKIKPSASSPASLIEVGPTITPAEVELLVEAPPRPLAEDSRLIETSLPPSARPKDLTREAPPVPAPAPPRKKGRRKKTTPRRTS